MSTKSTALTRGAEHG